MISKLLVHVSRFLVGGLFIFSGFVKLVDPIGSQYKFEEYFSESVLNIEFLIPYALPFAILLILAEILLGVMILIAYKPRFTVISLLIISLVFLFLTWYSAYYNKVTDCGCFGDAIKLTPWETFYKNVFLIVLILFLLIKIKFVTPLFSDTFGKIITFSSLAIFLFIIQHVLTHLPIIDFRAYAIGNNIPEGMQYKGDGELPPVHDFMLEDQQNDLTNVLMKKQKLMLIVMYDVEKATVRDLKAIRLLSLEAMKKGYAVYGVSSSFSDDVEALRMNYTLPFEFLFCDGTTLKTMIRANPGIMIFNKGTVTQKKNGVDLDQINL